MTRADYPLSRGLLDTAVPQITPEQARRAALFACEKATDMDDARDLVEALGLWEVLS